jgi:phage baseplate assembly protein W
MSQDLKLKHVCPHRVLCERLALSQDRQTLRTVQPPSSSRVTVHINGLDVPSTGMRSRASVRTPIPQPYTIPANTVLEVQVDQRATQQITLPAGTRVLASTLATYLNPLMSQVNVTAEDGRVYFEHMEEGPQTSLLFSNAQANAILGLPALRRYQGKEIYPSWTLVRDPRSPVPSDRIIRFGKPLKTLDDRFEVSYTTRRELCRRCSGLGIENDLRYDTQGDPIFVENQFLLLQEVEKIVFTIQGSNVFHRWYGTRLFDLIGTKITNGQFLETQLVSEIQTTLERYRQIKEDQSLIQEVTRAEQLNRIVSLTVEQDQRNPTIFRVDLVLENRAGRLESFADTLIVLDNPVRVN